MTEITDNERSVLDLYPNARVIWHPDVGVFKVYHFVGDCRIALSRGCCNIGEAWKDAAETLRAKEEITT